MKGEENPPSAGSSHEPTNANDRAWKNIQYAISLLILIFSGLFFLFVIQPVKRNTASDNSPDKAPPVVAASTQIIDGKDAETGLIAGDGYLIVKQNCTRCHSSKLITQNHLSRTRWEKTIRWMQKNQNLGSLGDNEKIILDYLEKNYGPTGQGRRKALEKQNWYYLR